jgi:hypothetical protein
MLPLIALVALQAEGTVYRRTILDSILGPGSLMMLTPVERTAKPRLSPKKFGEPPKSWEFDWNSSGYSYNQASGAQQIRFDLWSQESTAGSKRPEQVLRTLMRLYAYNVSRLRLQHAGVYNGTVNVFLCYGGEPGGEQLFEVDHQAEGDLKLNSIYLYDLRSFTDPVEMLREVAHEYGHATLPPIGGFKEPEDWANGYLGEKIYMTYLAEAMAKGELRTDDVLGATKEGIAAWKVKNVDPLISDAALNGPRPSLLAGKGKASMDALIGLALWTKQVYGDRVMVRALLMNGVDAKEFPASVSTAAEEPDIASLKIPDAFRGRPIWVPSGSGRFAGVTVLDSKSRPGWAKIQAKKSPAVVINWKSRASDLKAAAKP